MNNKTNVSHSTRRLTFCALFAALAVVFTRIISYAPVSHLRYSLGDIPIFLAGLFFGPLAGGLVGFGSDALGAVLMSPYGYNPMYCVPAVLYGIVGGLFHGHLAKKFSLVKLMISFLIPATIGSILVQSAVFAVGMPRSGEFVPDYLLYLLERGIQYAIVSVLDVTIMYFLIRSGIFAKVGVWPPKEQKELLATSGVARIVFGIVFLGLQLVVSIFVVNKGGFGGLSFHSALEFFRDLVTWMGNCVAGIVGAILIVFGVKAYMKERKKKV